MKAALNEQINMELYASYAYQVIPTAVPPFKMSPLIHEELHETDDGCSDISPCSFTGRIKALPA